MSNLSDMLKNDISDMFKKLSTEAPSSETKPAAESKTSRPSGEAVVEISGTKVPAFFVMRKKRE